MSVGSINDNEGAVRIDVNRSTVIVNVAVGLDYELANLQVDVVAEVVEAWCPPRIYPCSGMALAYLPCRHAH